MQGSATKRATSYSADWAVRDDGLTNGATARAQGQLGSLESAAWGESMAESRCSRRGRQIQRRPRTDHRVRFLRLRPDLERDEVPPLGT